MGWASNHASPRNTNTLKSKKQGIRIVGKRARVNLPDPKTQSGLYMISKKSGHGQQKPLRKSIYGTMVTEKMYKAQINNRNKRLEKSGLPIPEETE